MSAQRMRKLGEKRSVIRELFEYGNARKAEIGAENVFDFSIGNPSVPPPPEVNAELTRLLAEEDPLSLHSYTSAPGDMKVRAAIADQLNRTYGTAFSAGDLYMTVGAAASLTISLSAVLEPGDEVILFAPYFPEYAVFVETAGGVPVVVPSRAGDLQIDFDKLNAAITPRTRAVIINSPNNPSGAVLTADTLRQLADTLTAAGEAHGHTVYLISDEPYRELVYDGVEVPFVTPFYPATIVCYSYSKSLSLPGERIGYVLVPPAMPDKTAVYNAVCGAGRALGYVCAPALFQKLISACGGMTADRSVYARNRQLLYDALTSYGFEAVRPDGAFYLFVKAPEPDANAFCERAKKYELLLVPSDDFGMPGYVRIAYCVSTQQIERALPAFEKLAKEYQNG
ncbi:MAG: pyridoxal phosphate-dependent aminotransferase [Clostridia bacterium]|nr:pyridoxal phosphate-dependent aminotransferase [Clostridia bacterium]